VVTARSRQRLAAVLEEIEIETYGVTLDLETALGMRDW